MKLRFLVDVNVGLCVVKWLREQGYDAAAVQEIDPFMRDRDIIALAVMELSCETTFAYTALAG